MWNSKKACSRFFFLMMICTWRKEIYSYGFFLSLSLLLFLTLVNGKNAPTHSHVGSIMCYAMEKKTEGNFLLSQMNYHKFSLPFSLTHILTSYSFFLFLFLLFLTSYSILFFLLLFLFILFFLIVIFIHIISYSCYYCYCGCVDFATCFNMSC